MTTTMIMTSPSERIMSRDVSRPRLGFSSTSVTSCVADQIVVSVGPYMFHSEPTRGSSFAARSDGRASPPQRAFKPPPSQPAATSAKG